MSRKKKVNRVTRRSASKLKKNNKDTNKKNQAMNERKYNDT